MATKKQKREAGMAKQAIHRAESKRSGLAAQKRDREIRAKRAKDKLAEKNKAKNAELINSMAQTNNPDPA